jgi:hypothetical protein
MVLGALMGLAVLAGGILAQRTSASTTVGRVGAYAGQPVQVTQVATPGQSEAPAPAPPDQAPMPGGPMMGGFGERGFVHEGLGGPGMAGPEFGEKRFGGPGLDEKGFGPGKPGGPLTADGANRVISGTAGLIALVKGDLAYANGKMDTSRVQDWLNRADGLLKDAQSAVSSNQLERAVQTAEAARGLASAADTLMAQALGADKLPSYSQRPHPGKFGGNPTMPDATQAGASRQLVGFYNALVREGAVLKGSASAGIYLTAAQDSYKTAYAAYQAGKYNDARNAVFVGQQLLKVADDLFRASNAPTDPNAPVQVPAPNF